MNYQKAAIIESGVQYDKSQVAGKSNVKKRQK